MGMVLIIVTEDPREAEGFGSLFVEVSVHRDSWYTEAGSTPELWALSFSSLCPSDTQRDVLTLRGDFLHGNICADTHRISLIS